MTSPIAAAQRRLQRHPFAVEAFFRRSLVLTYALRPAVLAGFLGPGMELDEHQGWGFLAIAMVETEDLRPRSLPRWLGRNFFLSGYRIFVRIRRPGRGPLRGLLILRSDTDRAFMATLGNVFTHYGYRLARVEVDARPQQLAIRVHSRDHEADLDVVAQLSHTPAALPAASPFESLEAARNFAGPLPFTFSYDAHVNKIVVVKGVRKHWEPQPVQVQVNAATFLEHPRFAAGEARLANAFYLQEVPYAWKPGYLQEVG